MKICLVSDNLVGYHDTWSGAEMVVRYLDSLLKNQGQEVLALTIKSGKKKIPLKVFPIPALNGKLWSFKKIIPVHVLIRAISAFFILRKMKPDVLHFFHSNSLFTPVMICAKILKIPATFTVLDYWIICPTGHCLLENDEICMEKENKACPKCVSPLKLLERSVVRSLAKDLKYFITFTETSKKRLAERGFPPEKIKVKYIYDFSAGASEIKKEKIFRENDILFVGTFKKQKGLHVVIDSLPRVVFKIPDARLIVVGRGEQADKERIDIQIKKLKLENNIEFWGQKKNEEVLKIVANSNLTVTAEQWFSDFGPVALLEAMSLGRPVVAGNIGSAPDFIKDGVNGFLAEYNNPEKFAEKITWILQNKTKAEKAGEKAKETVKSLFKEGQNKEIFNLYANLNS